MIDIDFIKTAAKAKRITMKELAERIGYSVPGFYRACTVNNFKIDALQKVGEVLQITPESYIKDEKNLLIIQALNSSRITFETKPGLEINYRILEAERKHFEEEISHYRKQLEVKDRQIEYLMNQLEHKDNLIRTSTNFMRGMGVELNDEKEKIRGVDQK